MLVLLQASNEWVNDGPGPLVRLVHLHDFPASHGNRLSGYRCGVGLTQPGYDTGNFLWLNHSLLRVQSGQLLTRFGSGPPGLLDNIFYGFAQ